MIVDRLRRATRKFTNFYKKNGFFFTLLEVQYRFKLGIKKQHSYRSLLKKFPQRFVISQNPNLAAMQLPEIIDISIQETVQEIMLQLGISEDADRVLSGVRAFFGKNRYCKMVEDCLVIEQVRKTSPEQVMYPLVESAKLPEETYPLRRRRVLFVTSQFPSPYHGGGNRVLNFIKFLGETNEIYLVTSFFPQEDNNALGAVSPYCRSILKIPRQRFGGNQVEIRNWLAGEFMDVVHYEWPRSLENFDRAYGRYHIFTYMEAVSLRLLMDMQQLEPFSLDWLGKFPELFEALRLELADVSLLDARVAVTKKDGNFLSGLYPCQEYIILNHGVTFQEFCLPDVDPELHTLTFVGNYAHYPNVDAVNYFFAEIWDEVRSKIPDVRIYLVGANPTKEMIALDDGERIIVTGSVPDVRPYIQKASICIAPLKQGAGLRGKVVEYAALQRTFVATSIATTDLIFENGVDYFSADTSKEFAEKIVALLRNPKLSGQMSKSAFETARKNYDTPRLVSFLYRLYQHLEKV